MFRNKKFIAVTLSVLTSVLVVFAFVNAATVVDTNINTGGTLTVTDTATLYGATSVGGALTATSTLAVTGNFNVNGMATTTAASGNIATQGTLNVTGKTTLGNASTTLATFGATGTTIAGISFGTCAVDPQSITASSSALVSTSCAATGVVSGDKVFVTPPTAMENTLLLVGASASTTASGFIEIKIHNTGNTGNVDGASRTWSWMAIR